MHRALRNASLFTFLVCAWCAGFAQSPADSSHPVLLRVFPDLRIFPRMLASGTAHQLGLAKDFTTSLIRGSIGYEAPFIEASVGRTRIQIGAGATVFASIIKMPRLLQVVTVDFLVEFPVDISISENMAFRTGYGHFSAHFADDGIEILGRSSVNYAKDYLLALGMWRIPAAVTLYGGARYDYHTIPEETRHWVLEWGAESADLRLASEALLYFAVDFKWKSEVAMAGTQSYQCGVRLFPRGGKSVRLAYTFRAGIDDRGQFYRERADISQLGAYLDF